MVLLYFWGGWNRVCEFMTPVIDELAIEYKDKLVVVKIELANANIDLLKRLGVIETPYFIFIKNSVIFGREFVILNPESHELKWIIEQKLLVFI